MLTIATKFVSPGLAEQFRKIVSPIEEYKTIAAQSSAKADALVYELGDAPEMDFEVIQAYMQSGNIQHLLLIAADPSKEVLMEAIRLGVIEILPPSLDQEQLLSALYKVVEKNQAVDKAPTVREGKIINVLGSKGGVGTTTISVNLAATLSSGSPSKDVVLLDMNTLFGDIPLFLNLETKFHWGEITKNMDRMDDTFLSNILEKHDSGISVLSSPAYLNGHIAPTPETIEHILNVMKQMFDYVIIDAGQSTNDTGLKIIQMANEVLLVTTLSLPCLSTANKLIQSYTNLGYASEDKIKIIINRHLKKTDISIKEAEEGLARKVFWTVPNDYTSTMSAINQGKPLKSIYPKAAITRSIDDLAGTLISKNSESSNKNIRKGFFFRRH